MDPRLARVPSDLPPPPPPPAAEGLVGVSDVAPRARAPSFEDLRTLSSHETIQDVLNSSRAARHRAREAGVVARPPRSPPPGAVTRL